MGLTAASVIAMPAANLLAATTLLAAANLLAATGIPWFAILLVIAFYALVGLEFFLPTGGTAGIAAVIAIVAAIVISLEYGIYWAVGILLVTTLTTPPLIIALIRVWPRTIIGRRILNKRDDDPPVQTSVATTRRGTPLDSLIGRRGVAVSHLLPAGMVKIDGERINAVSVGLPINQDDRIIVVGLENRHLQVRLTKEPPEDHHEIDPSTIHTAGDVNSADTPANQSPRALEFDLDRLTETD